jgi:hypothetical protein
MEKGRRTEKRRNRKLGLEASVKVGIRMKLLSTGPVACLT